MQERTGVVVYEVRRQANVRVVREKVKHSALVILVIVGLLLLALVSAGVSGHAPWGAPLKCGQRTREISQARQAGPADLRKSTNNAWSMYVAVAVELRMVLFADVREFSEPRLVPRPVHARTFAHFMRVCQCRQTCVSASVIVVADVRFAATENV